MVRFPFQLRFNYLHNCERRAYDVHRGYDNPQHRFVIERVESFGLDILQKVELAYNLKTVHHLLGHYDELPIEIRFEHYPLDYMTLRQDHHSARSYAVAYRIYGTRHMPAVHDYADSRIGT